MGSVTPHPRYSPAKKDGCHEINLHNQKQKSIRLNEILLFLM
jgi:hypothetical protein